MPSTQLKMTYGKFSVYSEPFDDSASDEVVQHIQEELNKRFAIQAQIPIGGIIDAEFIEANMHTGMYGFMKTLVEDVTPEKVSTVYQDTVDAFFAENPEPQPLDFTCARCKAKPWKTCTKPNGEPTMTHAPRLDRMGTARLKRHNAAHRAALAAADEHDRRRPPTP